MFDLPVRTKNQRREATRFRNHLLDLGFCMVQYSVYVQYLPLAARLTPVVRQIRSELPAGGDVRILTVTDIQWSKALRFSNSIESKSEEEPLPLTIF